MNENDLNQYLTETSQESILQAMEAVCMADQGVEKETVLMDLIGLLRLQKHIEAIAHSNMIRHAESNARS